MRNAQNYSRMLTSLLVAGSFVAVLGSVSAQTPVRKAAPGSTPQAPAAKPPEKSVAATTVGSAKPQGTVATSVGKPTLAVKASTPALRKTSRATSQRNVRQGPQRLVPPPPPSIPLANLAVIGGSANVPANLQYMSKGELAKLAIKLKDQMEKSKTRLDEHEKRVKAQREKIALYTKLLQEGVVSRRDLETAKNELDDLESRTSELEEQAMNLNGDLFNLKKMTPPPKTH